MFFIFLSPPFHFSLTTRGTRMTKPRRMHLSFWFSPVILLPHATWFLVAASGASWLVTRLRVGLALLSLLAFLHHLLEVHVAAKRILVASLSRVETTGIWAVTIPSFEGVEVEWRSGCSGIPCFVNYLLGFVVPKLSVVNAVIKEKGGWASTSTERLGSKGRGASDGYNNKEFLKLKSKKKREQKLDVFFLDMRWLVSNGIWTRYHVNSPQKKHFIASQFPAHDQMRQVTS